jgi:hypothetical protein
MVNSARKVAGSIEWPMRWNCSIYRASSTSVATDSMNGMVTARIIRAALSEAVRDELERSDEGRLNWLPN